MTSRRVMGTETEFGIVVPGQPTANAMVASSLVVTAVAPSRASRGRLRWDFEEENPLRDARGFDVGLGDTDHGDADLGLANVILTNGARFYVDHAHPEYSSPEVTNALDAVVWDKAGELVAQAAAAKASAVGPDRILLYKNNTDNKGASYGSHENYLMPRRTPFLDVVKHLIPFFVSRQVVCGAGRVGIGQEGRGDGFQVSQRADYFEVEVGLETTLKRPIVNTRDEPHADPEKWRRLHVIIGDANLAETSIFLKLGTTALVLSMIEDGWLAERGVDLSVEQSVQTLRAVSHDPTLELKITLRDGRRMTAVQLQQAYLEEAQAYTDARTGADTDPVTRQVLDTWTSVTDRLARDPMLLADELDWVAKYSLLQGYRDREGLAWSAPKLALVDLQYADLRPDRGLYNRLAARGAMKRLVGENEVLAATTEPPTDTRAYFRGRCLGRYPEQVAAASWDSVIFDVGRDSLQRVPTLDPLRGTEAHVGALLDECDDALSLVDRLTGRA